MNHDHDPPTLSGDKQELRWAQVGSDLTELEFAIETLKERVAALERSLAGPPEGPGFGELTKRVAELERFREGEVKARDIAEQWASRVALIQTRLNELSDIDEIASRLDSRIFRLEDKLDKIIEYYDLEPVIDFEPAAPLGPDWRD